MSSLELVPLVARWAHVLGAIVLVGGLAYLTLVALPSLSSGASGAERSRLRSELDRRWRWLVIASSVVLLASGLYNLIGEGLAKGDAAPGYHAWFGAKFVLAIVVFFMAAALSGRSAALSRLRSGGSAWGPVTLAAAVLVVLIAGVLRSFG
jgi:uncharacterized membrane protein